MESGKLGPEGAPVYVALVHHPVYNKRRQTVTTAITNLDVHDLARLGRTFGVRRYYVVTPISAQRALARSIVDHWVVGEGGQRNPRRREAMLRVGVAADIDAALADVQEREGRAVELVVTGANFGEDTVSFAAARERIRTGDTPLLVVFGTGWGLHDEVVERSDWKLEPLLGYDDYNHLAVRTAAGIILDRLLGRSRDEQQGE